MELPLLIPVVSGFGPTPGNRNQLKDLVHLLHDNTGWRIAGFPGIGTYDYKVGLAKRLDY